MFGFLGACCAASVINAVELSAISFGACVAADLGSVCELCPDLISGPLWSEIASAL